MARYVLDNVFNKIEHNIQVSKNIIVESGDVYKIEKFENEAENNVLMKNLKIIWEYDELSKEGVKPFDLKHIKKCNNYLGNLYVTLGWHVDFLHLDFDYFFKKILSDESIHVIEFHSRINFIKVRLEYNKKNNEIIVETREDFICIDKDVFNFEGVRDCLSDDKTNEEIEEEYGNSSDVLILLTYSFDKFYGG